MPVPLQAPDQPAKVDPEAGAAEKVTAVPAARFVLHEAPQLMPPAEEETVPLPFPALVTDSV
jgi:hypothetical protein